MSGRELFLEIIADNPDTIKKNYGNLLANPKQPLAPHLKSKGRAFNQKSYVFPFKLLSCEGKKLTLSSIFPEDKQTPQAWMHKIVYGGDNSETLSKIAEWFTGAAMNAKKVASLNNLEGSNIAEGQTLSIPASLLLSCIELPKEIPVISGDLTFGKDAKGQYAEYVLRKGQAMYSDVVIRFTPRVTAKEVLEAADLILNRSGLKSFKDIPANTPLKIPLDLLSPEFLAPTDPRRIQFEQTAKESKQFKKTISSSTLEGFTVVLDSGHGGSDPGTIGVFGEREDEYAYDIMCRTKLLLETTTKAKVLTTIMDDTLGYKPRSEKILISNKEQEKILTSPPYNIDDPTAALKLRTFLANYYLDTNSKKNDTDEKFIFTSFHADSLHPTAHGVMVYIPGADYYNPNYNCDNAFYLSRKEVKGRNFIKMTRQEQLKAQGFSQTFANDIVKKCLSLSVKMHSVQPVREYIVRSGKIWVPFVLKYCKIPTRVLIEVANMKSSSDCQLLQSWEYRQKIAQMYVEAVKDYFKTE
jgi:N-acetylmuramoyl-L-alanine amidase